MRETRADRGLLSALLGSDSRPPHYMPETPAEVNFSKMVYRGAWNSRDVMMHIQEFAENRSV